MHATACLKRFRGGKLEQNSYKMHNASSPSMLLQYVIRKLLLLIPTLLAVTVIAFLIVHLIPGDPVQLMVGFEATPADIQRVRAEWGLDQPLPVQYFVFLNNLLHGNLGISITTRRPVLEEILFRFPNSLLLASVAMLISALIGVPVGIVSAQKPYSLMDHSGMLGSIFAVSMPVMSVGLFLIILFSSTLRLFPSMGYGLTQLILPSITLAAASTAIIARHTRASMIEAMEKEYIVTALSKGLSENTVTYRHALKNALIPVVTVAGLQFTALLSGSVIVETLFAWPGLGKFVVDAVFARDYPVIIGGILAFALASMLLNLLVDILYSWIDPRIEY